MALISRPSRHPQLRPATSGRIAQNASRNLPEPPPDGSSGGAARLLTWPTKPLDPGGRPLRRRCAVSRCQLGSASQSHSAIMSLLGQRASIARHCPMDPRIPAKTRSPAHFEPDRSNPFSMARSSCAVVQPLESRRNGRPLSVQARINTKTAANNGL